MRIMVTRPHPEGEILCERIRNEGGIPFYFPLLTIQPRAHEAELSNILQQSKAIDWMIFVSPRAVAPVAQQLQSIAPISFKIAAVGEKTAETLRHYHLPVTCCPEDWRSEGLLQLPEFQAVAESTIVIVSGEGGRTLLADTLTERGARVIPLSVYRRKMPEASPEACLNLLREKKIDIIIITSLEALNNCLSWIGVEHRSFLLRTPLLVISERIKKEALALGFHSVIVAKNAADGSIIAALKQQGMNTMNWKTMSVMLMMMTVIALFSLFYVGYVMPKMADQRSDASLNTLNQAMQQLTLQVNQQGQAIQSLHRPNEETVTQKQLIEETYQQLMTVDHALDQLPIMTPETDRLQQAQNNMSAETENMPWWKRGLVAAGNTLKTIVVIRHHQDRTLPLVLPDMREFLYQNCHAKVSTAVWGLLHHSPLIYQKSLAELSQWVSIYFVATAEPTQAVLNQLSALQKVTVGE